MLLHPENNVYLHIMSQKEHQTYIAEIQAYTAKVLQSEDAARAFLKSSGIHTKSGRLSSHYSHSSQKATVAKVTSK